MAKRSSQHNDKWNNKPARRRDDDVQLQDETYYTPAARFVRPTTLEPQTDAQADFLGAIRGNTVSMGIGPAGTGKTYVAAAFAEQQLFDKRVERILITRPAVDAGEDLGALPGELDEKFAPYLQPFEQCFVERMGRGAYDYALKAGKIQPMTIGHMRGITFKNCIVLLDEAQNLTPKQMKMFLTRIGEGCKVIITGDPKQVDIRGLSGLVDAERRLQRIAGIRVICFGVEDIVRCGLVQDIVERYELEEEAL